MKQAAIEICSCDLFRKKIVITAFYQYFHIRFLKQLRKAYRKNETQDPIRAQDPRPYENPEPQKYPRTYENPVPCENTRPAGINDPES